MSSDPRESLELLPPLELAEQSESVGKRRPELSDHRPLMVELPPVRLLAVEDVRVPAAPGLEKKLDRFYVDLLEFERDTTTSSIVYRAENFRVRVDILDPPVERQDYRGVTVEVRSLADTELLLIEHEIEYERLKGLTPGEQSLFLRDPAGNGISIVERRELM